MSYTVLPALFIFSVEWKPVHDKLVYPVQSDFFVRLALNGHRDEGDIAVGWFDHVFGRLMRGAVVGVRGRATHGPVLVRGVHSGGESSHSHGGVSPVPVVVLVSE